MYISKICQTKKGACGHSTRSHLRYFEFYGGLTLQTAFPLTRALSSLQGQAIKEEGALRVTNRKPWAKPQMSTMSDLRI